MFLTEYDEKKVLEMEREEGQIVERERVATDMIKEGGMSVSLIARISKLSEDTVRDLARSLGIAVSWYKQLMDACEPLKEYAWLVDAVWKRQSEKTDLDAAVDAAINAHHLQRQEQKEAIHP